MVRSAALSSLCALAAVATMFAPLSACGRTEQTSDLRSTGGTSSDQKGMAADQDEVIVPTPNVQVDVKVNGEDGPVYVPAGTTVELSWTSVGASFCTGPDLYTLSGKQNVVVAEPTGFTVKCMNGDGTVLDTVMVEIGEKPDPTLGSPGEDGFERHLDVSFCSAGASTDLKADVVLPKTAGTSRPALVMIHGGSWTTGSRKSLADMQKEAAARGFAAVSIDYRLTGSLFPGQVEDVKCAIRWLRTRATEYGIDKERIGIFGISSGAHLAMLAAYSDETDFKNTQHDAESSRVQAVVNWSGPVDLTALYPTLSIAERGEMVYYLGGAPAQKATTYATASPITYVTSDDPPTWTSHGSLDMRIPLAQAEALELRTVAVDSDHTLEVLDQQGHEFKGAGLAQATASATAFFSAKLKP